MRFYAHLEFISLNTDRNADAMNTAAKENYTHTRARARTRAHTHTHTHTYIMSNVLCTFCVLWRKKQFVVHVDGMRLSLNCGHRQAYCLFCRWYMHMETHSGMILTRENRRTQRKTCPNANLPTTNPTWTDQSTNPGPPRWQAGE